MNTVTASFTTFAGKKLEVTFASWATHLLAQQHAAFAALCKAHPTEAVEWEKVGIVVH